MKMRKKTLAIVLFSVAFVSIVMISALVLWQNEAFTPGVAPAPLPSPSEEVADSHLYPALGESGLWGFIDSNGKMVIPATYDEADVFVGKIAWVKTAGYWGAIDQAGQIVIPCDYGSRSYVDSANSPLVMAKANRNEVSNSSTKSGTVSFYDGDGVKIFGVEGEIGKLSNGLMAFSRMKDGFKLWGYLDTTGKIVVEPIYKEVGLADQDYVMVMDFSDKKYILKLSDGSTTEVPAEVQLNNLASRRILMTTPKGLYGYLDIDGKPIIEPNLLYAEVFRNESALAKSTLGYGLIDQSGSFITKTFYKKGEYLGNGFYSFKNSEDGPATIIDSKGVVIMDNNAYLIGSWRYDILPVQTSTNTRFLQVGKGLLPEPIGGLQTNLYAIGSLLVLLDDNGIAYYRPDGTVVYAMGREIALKEGYQLQPKLENPSVYCQIYYPQISALAGEALPKEYAAVNGRLATNSLADYLGDYKNPDDSINFAVKGSYKQNVVGDVVTVLQKTEVTDLWVSARDGFGSEFIYDTVCFQKSTGRQFTLSALFAKGVNWRDDLLQPLSEIYSIACAGKGIEENPEVQQFLQERLSRSVPYILDKNELTIYAKLAHGGYEAITLRYQDFEGIIDQKGDLWLALQGQLN